jgi:hypothetical protein
MVMAMTDEEADALRAKGIKVFDAPVYYLMFDAAGQCALMRNTNIAFRKHLKEIRGRLSAISSLNEVVTEKSSALAHTPASQMEAIVRHAAAVAYSERLKQAAEQCAAITQDEDIGKAYNGPNNHHPIGLVSSRPSEGGGYVFVDDGVASIKLYI